MNDPKVWELDDLHELIATQAEESSTLEFKHGQVLEDLINSLVADKRKIGISIDVSAFANRSGGTIVYGMEEDAQEPHSATALTPIDSTKCSKERLEQIIASRIKPPIQNIVIRPIRTSANSCVFIVIIPSSNTAHQACDNRYYRRGNFSNEMLEDDEIRQIMTRQTRLTYRVQITTRLIGQGELFITGIVQNTSVMIGNDVSAVLLLPNELARNTVAGTEVFGGDTFVRMLDDFRNQVKSQLKPFESKEICFQSACKIPNPIPSLTAPLIVRVYDQFGQAHEEEFVISLGPGREGQIINEQK